MTININDISDKKELEALLKLAQALLGNVEKNKADIEDKPTIKHKCAVKRRIKTVRTLPKRVLEEIERGDEKWAVEVFAAALNSLLKAQ